MLRSSLAAAFSAVLAAGIAQSAAAQEAAEQRLGAVHLRDLVQRRRAAPVRPRHALPALVLVSRVERDFRGHAQGRSGLRHRLLGDRNEPAAQSVRRRRPPPIWRTGSRPSRRAKAIGAKTPRENDFIAALGAFYTDYDKLDHRTRVQAYLKAMEALAQRYPRGRRGADLLRPRAQRRGLARRQDLRQSAQGRGDPGAASSRASRSIRASRTI